MKIKVLILIFICLQIQPVNSQIISRFDYYFGYGYYEGIHIGTEYFLKSQTQSVSLSLGGYYNLSNKDKFFTITPGYNIAIFRKSKGQTGYYKWHLNNKFVFWQLEDDYYIWKVVSFIPSLCYQMPVVRNVRISFDAGPSMNLVLYNKRKTYKEVGWPYHVYPNFSIKLIF